MTRWPWVLLNPIPESYRHAILYTLLFTLLSCASWQLDVTSYVLSANWLATSIAVVLILHSPSTKSRNITLSYIVAISVVSIGLSPHFWLGMGAIIRALFPLRVGGNLYLQ